MWPKIVAKCMKEINKLYQIGAITTSMVSMLRIIVYPKLYCLCRGITFLLTCWLGCIICLGMVIACGAGIAYGYNYCMAEWLTFGKSDVTVYMRRGQFGKDPLAGGGGRPVVNNEDPRPRRRNPDFEGDDSPALNATAEDYEEEQPGKPKRLGKAWSKAKDTRQYAEKLTKYAHNPDTSEQEVQVQMPTTVAGYYLLTSPPKRRITASPLPLVETTVWKTGSSEIIMRRFEPIDTDVSSTPSHLRPLEGVRENDEFFYRVSNVPMKTTYDDDYRPTEPQVELRVADRKQAPYKYIPMRHWGVTTPESPVIPDELVTDPGDEESAVYKNN